MHIISTAQELEEQRRREVSEREMIERCKEEEKRTFQDEIDGLRQLLHQEFEQIKTKSVSIEAVSVDHLHIAGNRWRHILRSTIRQNCQYFNHRT